MAETETPAELAQPTPTEDATDYCDCEHLCPMGPTCPGAPPDLPGAGCWRVRQADR